MADEELQTVTDDNLSADDTQNTEVLTDETTGGDVSSEPAKVEFSEAQQKVFDTAIAKKGLTAKKAEIASQAAIGDLQQQLTAAQSQLPQSIRPTIPELPDKYDEDFAGKMATRDQAIQEASTFDANQQAAQQLLNNQALAAQQTQQKASQDLAETFVGRSEKLGVSKENLQTAIETVAAYGGLGDVANVVMENENGPLITAYLAENPAEVLAIQKLPPMQGVAYLVSNVMPKAVANKPSPGAPAPVDGLSGNGTTVSDEGPAGATYE